MIITTLNVMISNLIAVCLVGSLILFKIQILLESCVPVPQLSNTSYLSSYSFQALGKESQLLAVLLIKTVLYSRQMKIFGTAVILVKNLQSYKKKNLDKQEQLSRELLFQYYSQMATSKIFFFCKAYYIFQCRSFITISLHAVPHSCTVTVPLILIKSVIQNVLSLAKIIQIFYILAL